MAETPPKEMSRAASFRTMHPTRSRSPSPSVEESSWQTMYANTSSDDEGDFGDGAIRVHTPPSPAPSPASLSSQRPTLSKAPSFSRLRATFTAIADVASTSASSTLHMPVTHPSRPSSPTVPSRRRHRISSISMSSSAEVPPEPAIRRSQRSHPDITSLCKSWAESGPANPTKTYKPDVVTKHGELVRQVSFTRA